LRMKN
jgi:ribosomal protein S17E